MNGKPATKPALKVEAEDLIEVTQGVDYVSRAGAKLAWALEAFAVKVTGTALDAGASTGGFTQA